MFPTSSSFGSHLDPIHFLPFFSLFTPPEHYFVKFKPSMQTPTFATLQPSLISNSNLTRVVPMPPVGRGENRKALQLSFAKQSFKCFLFITQAPISHETQKKVNVLIVC